MFQIYIDKISAPAGKCVKKRAHLQRLLFRDMYHDINTGVQMDGGHRADPLGIDGAFISKLGIQSKRYYWKLKVDTCK